MKGSKSQIPGLGLTGWTHGGRAAAPGAGFTFGVAGKILE